MQIYILIILSTIKQQQQQQKKTKIMQYIKSNYKNLLTGIETGHVNRFVNM